MSSDRSKPEVAHLRKLVLSAAFLHREFLGIRAEENFRSAYNGKVHYAFDSDVLDAFASPWQWGPESVSDDDEGGWAYGQLLPRKSSVRKRITESDLKRQRIEEDVRAINVTKLLCKFILKTACRSGVGGRLLQFTPHYRETTVGSEIVQDRAERHGYRDRGNATEKLFHNAILILRARLSSYPQGTNLVKTLQNVAEVALTRELSGPSRVSVASDNYHRLEQWGERRRLNSLSDLEHSDSDVSPNELDEKAYALLINFWVSEFSQGRLHTSPASVQSDAEALAKLAIINKQLIDRGIAERVVLVTGSKSIVKLSYRCGDRLRRYLRNRYANELSRGFESSEVREERRVWDDYFAFSKNGQKENARFEWFDRFSLHYVRHLSAYAKGALIENEDTQKLDNLFHGLFALQSKWNRFRRSDIEEIVEHPWRLKLEFLEKEPNTLYLEVLEQWDQLTMRALEAERSFDWNFPSQAEHYLESRFSDHDNVSALQLGLDISEQVDRQRDRSMLELSDMGARALLERGMLSARNPPDLFFSRFSATNRIFKNLGRPGYYAKNPQEFIKDYDSIDVDSFGPEETSDGDDRQRSYLKFVVLGAVFASAEKWSTALGHAQRAVRTVERYPSKPAAVKVTPGSDDAAQLTAREAHYLSAVCFRMLAKDRAGLEVARETLRKAEVAYSSDVKEMPSLSNRLGTLRFRSESLAIELSGYYFDRWHAVSDDDKKHLTCRDFTVNGIYEAADELIAQLTRGSDTFSGPMTSLTAVSVATNILQVATIRAFRKSDGCDDSEISMTVSDDLIEQSFYFLLSKARDAIYVETNLVRAYRNTGAMLLGLEDLSDFASRSDFGNFLLEAAENGVMRYDEWRYQSLRDFIMTFSS